MTVPAPPPIIRRGPALPASPIVLAVPHAGRHYSERLLRDARLPQAVLSTLEDRHADRLVEAAVHAGATALVATTARAWIDLNRDPREIDPAMLASPPRAADLRDSAKLRGGLGLIPRRIARAGDIWRHRLTAAEIAGRIAEVHRPWHAAIETALAAAKSRFGAAVLIDCHSMPPLPGERPPRLVLGDRRGASADASLMDALATEAASWGIPVARNVPYAGDHALERHGRPGRGIHAVQLELCRSLYLDERHDGVSASLSRAQALVAGLAAAAACQILNEAAPAAIAAE